MTKRSSTKRIAAVTVDRRRLKTALERCRRVIPTRIFKPVLECVRLSCADGQLSLAATDNEISLTSTIEADGDLRPCLVPCDALFRRVKASKDELSTIRLADNGRSLVFNGGPVDHKIHTLDPADFPAVPNGPLGLFIRFDAERFGSALATALVATAAEASRYSLNAVRLEADAKGTRFVAIDGRRLVVCDLHTEDCRFRGEVNLPKPLANLAVRLIDARSDEPVVLLVRENPDKNGEPQPADLFVRGPDWMLSSKAAEGTFPKYHDVIPKSASRFVVDRRQLLDTLDAVAVSAGDDHRSVMLDLNTDAIKLSAASPEVGESSAEVPAVFQGGGDRRIITALNPAYFRDALRTLTGDQVVIDVQQNGFSPNDKSVSGKPVVMYDADSPTTSWVVMSINTGLPPSHETLGSNFKGTDGTNTSVEAVTEVPTTSGATGPVPTTSKPRRQRVVHVWPEIGTRLDGPYEGETYAGLVVAAPKLKSGRALQLITGPAMGRIFNSMTSAMIAATERQRRKLGHGKGRRGLPATGWEFWKRPEPKRQSA